MHKTLHDLNNVLLAFTVLLLHIMTCIFIVRTAFQEHISAGAPPAAHSVSAPRSSEFACFPSSPPELNAGARTPKNAE